MISRVLSRRLVALRRRQPVAPAPVFFIPEPEPQHTLADLVELCRQYIISGDRDRIDRLRAQLDANGYRRVSAVPPHDVDRMYRLLQELPR